MAVCIGYINLLNISWCEGRRYAMMEKEMRWSSNSKYKNSLRSSRLGMRIKTTTTTLSFPMRPLLYKIASFAMCCDDGRRASCNL